MPSQPGARWPDRWIQFDALAQATTTLECMTTVYILPLRDVFTAAKAESTTSEVAGGRVQLGVGVGWSAWAVMTGDPCPPGSSPP